MDSNTSTETAQPTVAEQTNSQTQETTPTPGAPVAPPQTEQPKPSSFWNKLINPFNSTKPQGPSILPNVNTETTAPLNQVHQERQNSMAGTPTVEPTPTNVMTSMSADLEPVGTPTDITAPPTPQPGQTEEQKAASINSMFSAPEQPTPASPTAEAPNPTPQTPLAESFTPIAESKPASETPETPSVAATSPTEPTLQNEQSAPPQTPTATEPVAAITNESANTTPNTPQQPEAATQTAPIQPTPETTGVDTVGQTNSNQGDTNNGSQPGGNPTT